MKVSVVLPVYNVEEYIKRCLDSILEQTFADFEIIIVDDCGTDGSMEIARRYEDANPERIRIVKNHENMGLGCARNRGIDNAKGEYITFIDSDDCIESDYLEKFVSALKDDTDLVVGGYTLVKDGREKAFPATSPKTEEIYMHTSACAKLYRTSFIKENDVKFPEIKRYEDELFRYKLLSFSPKVTLADTCGYRYMLRNNSITRTKKKDRSDLFSEYALNVKDCFLETKVPTEQKEIYEYTLAMSLISNLLYNGRGSGISKMKKNYNLYDKMIKKVSPGILSNKYVSLKKPADEPMINKVATFAVVKLRKIGMDKLAFYAASLLPKA